MSDEDKVYIDEDFLDEDLYDDLFDDDEDYEDEEQELLEEGFSIDEDDDTDIYDKFGPLDD
jgi:hypothetical protein